MLLIGSNLFLILPIKISFDFGNYAVAWPMIIAMIFSSIYHTCDSTGFCFGVEQGLVWKRMDYIFAFYQMVQVFIFLVDFNIYSKNAKTRLTQQNWLTGAQFILFTVVILVVLIDPFGSSAAYIIICTSAALIYVKFIFIDRGRIRFEKRFKKRFIVVGVGFLVVGVAFFKIDGPFYWLFHTIWHISVFFGIYYLVLGGSKHLPFWKDYMSGSFSYYIFVLNPMLRLMRAFEDKDRKKRKRSTETKATAPIV